MLKMYFFFKVMPLSKKRRILRVHHFSFCEIDLPPFKQQKKPLKNGFPFPILSSYDFKIININPSFFIYLI